MCSHNVIYDCVNDFDQEYVSRYTRPPFPDIHAIVLVAYCGKLAAPSYSLRQSMKANEATPTGEWKEESTVFADVEPMELEGSSVRVYDCAGQVAYVNDVGKFYEKCSMEALRDTVTREHSLSA